MLDLCLLAVMGEGPAYGYEMTKHLGERGLSIVGEGSTIRCWADWSEMAWWTLIGPQATGDRRGSHYQLSRQGQRALATGIDEWRPRGRRRRRPRSGKNGGGVMSRFVEDCRREWRRLGVPEVEANEMATDLEAVSLKLEPTGQREEVLGNKILRR